MHLSGLLQNLGGHPKSKKNLSPQSNYKKLRHSDHHGSSRGGGGGGGEEAGDIELLLDGRPSTCRVPPGYLPVCVGSDAKRYLIKAKHLHHPLFIDLLELSAQEYGYSHQGILRLFCDPNAFERALASSSSSSTMCSLLHREIQKPYTSHKGS